ncbi:MAG: M3 family peptidase, partial [Candidatus Thioglobus sp.]|nr:M3 family peptidase [Candidatus Thioglobus sp.]
MNLIPNFKPENIVQSIENITKKGFEVVSSAEKGGNWDEVITATDNFECELGRLTSVNSHLNAVMFSDEFNTQYEQTLPIITNFYSDISSNKALYTAYKNLKN